VKHERRFLRAPVQVWVRNLGKNELSVWLEDETLSGDFTFCYSTQDISEGGLFLETDQPMTVNEELRLELALPGFPPFEVAARVKWVRDTDKALEVALRQGMGLEFVSMTPEARAALRAYLDPREAAE
jgi:uncharacterized protein (TIGR02266 family)